MSSPPKWPQEHDDFIRANWGVIPAEIIGERLGGRSKNSVIGRAHRIGLARLVPSSTMYKGPDYKPKRNHKRKSSEPQIKRAGIVTLPAIAALRTGNPEVREAPAVVIPFVPRKPAPIKHEPLLSKQPCCWPFGDPKDKANFRFCCEPTVLGRSYCPKHCREAYVSKPDRMVRMMEAG